MNIREIIDGGKPWKSCDVENHLTENTIIISLQQTVHVFIGSSGL